MRSMLRHRNAERLRVDDVRVAARKTLCLVGADDGAVRLFDGGHLDRRDRQIHAEFARVRQHAPPEAGQPPVHLRTRVSKGSPSRLSVSDIVNMSPGPAQS